jgi:multiple sugar transport system permease protein
VRRLQRIPHLLVGGAAHCPARIDCPTILSFQGSWNEFPFTLVAVQSPELYTLPRGLADLVSGSLGAGTQYPHKLGAALLATIPVAVIFLVFQRYFVREANEGSVKG